jgi:Ca-activated chloride channel family protein
MASHLSPTALRFLLIPALLAFALAAHAQAPPEDAPAPTVPKVDVPPAPQPRAPQPPAPQPNPPQTGEPEAEDDEAEAEAAAQPADGQAKGKKRKKVREKVAIAALPPKYREWLEMVAIIMTKEEKAVFLELEKDYQRDAYIERFWKARDPYPDTARNEFREDFNTRVREAREYFNNASDDRTRVLLTNGFPTQRIEVRCAPDIVPTEVWYYEASDTVRFEFLLLFYQQWGVGNFRVWQPLDGLNVLQLAGGSNLTVGGILDECGQKGEAIAAAIGFMSREGSLGSMALMSRVVRAPEVMEKEWVSTFSTYSTDLDPDAPTFDADLQLTFPSRNQSRTVLQGNLVVPTAQLGRTELGESRSYNLLMTGEILREGTLFDSFRYKFDMPADQVGDKLPLLFERSLRPGAYTLIVKTEDQASGKAHRLELKIDVPTADDAVPLDSETARVLAEANDAITSDETTVKLPAMVGNWQTGMVRMEALTTGKNIARVVFYLDDLAILTKKSPPWNVEIDLGKTPRARVLRVEAFDAEGRSLATDETLLNSGDHRFAVRLSEPRPKKRYERSLRAQGEIVVPKGDVVERVEIYLNETLLATLYQPPWTLPVVLPQDAIPSYVRMVAYRPDGSSAEDLVFVNAPDNLETVEVDFVELYTLVVDGNRPVAGLQKSDFQVLEDGVEQEVVRFELVENLPIHAAVVLDVSASMEEQMDLSREAALHFFQQAITPKDRASLITFNDHPGMAVPFTNDANLLAAGLAGLKAERGTALFDAVVYSLYYFNGIAGQKAMILLSDGKDESSRFSYDDMLDYARRSRVAIYPIGLKLAKLDLDVRRKLNRLAEETGGRGFFAEEATELTGIYESIQKELRSRYLLAYQSSSRSASQAFRTIDVKIKTRPSLEAKTLRGYYP